MFDLASEIRRRREALRLSQRTLAARFGMDHSYLSRIEDGKRLLGPRFAWQVAQFLDIPAERVVSAIAHERIWSQAESLVRRTGILVALDLGDASPESWE